MERFSARAVHSNESSVCANSPSLQDLLTNTCQMLHDILKAIADTDHLEVMLEIESLVALAT